MIISPDAHTAFREDVLKRYPQEACGLVIGGKYFACKNVSPQPLGSFSIDARQRLELTLRNGPVEAVLHSHPYTMEESREYYKNKYDPTWPTEADQLGFLVDEAPWGIVACDGSDISAITWMVDEPMPIEGRKFAWFTADCYTCVRDWFHTNTDFKLPNFSRRWKFWEDGLNTIEDGLRTIPFARILPTSEAQPGDAVVFTIGGSMVNHLAVITGPNEILHQFANKYANLERWDKWAPSAKYVIRLERNK
jgi:cell wall-associated NlpC family hydrolase